MGIRVVEGLGVPERGGDQTQLVSGQRSASVWIPLMVAATACVVRNVLLVPLLPAALDSVNYWTLNLMASRRENVPPNPTGAPGTAGTDLIAARPVNGGVNNFAQYVPWDFGTVVWTEAEAHLLPRDTLGIWAAKTGAAADLPAFLASVRTVPESV